MLQALRKRFIIVAMAVVLALEFILFLSINGVHFIQQKRSADHMLDFLLRYEGVFPKERKPSEDEFYRNPELAYTTRYFTVRVTPDNRIAAVDTEHIAAIRPAEAMELSKDIILSEKTGGRRGSYLFKVSRDERTGVRLLVFLDVSASHERVLWLLASTSGIMAGFAFLTFILLVLFSGRAVKPFIENEKKQQQFIHDAGHELKTPLAVISADLDVLELSGQGNRWTESMRRQTERMKNLIENFLQLARYDEMPALHYERIQPEYYLNEVLEQLNPVLSGRGITVFKELKTHAELEADPKAFQDLLFILCENMAKYAPLNSSVRITVAEQNNQLLLQFYNAAPNFVPGDEERVFERFYRGDKARSRNGQDPGGSGMGLAIAKRIAESHKGSIGAVYKDGIFMAEVRLPGLRKA